MDCIYRVATARYPEKVAAQTATPAGRVRYRPAFTATCAADAGDDVKIYHGAPHGEPADTIVVRVTRAGGWDTMSVVLDAGAARAMMTDIGGRLGLDVEGALARAGKAEGLRKAILDLIA